MRTLTVIALASLLAACVQLDQRNGNANATTCVLAVCSALPPDAPASSALETVTDLFKGE